MVRSTIACVLAFLLLTGGVRAQVSPDIPSASGSSLPSTCAPAYLFFLTSGEIGLYACTATDTWTQLGSGAGVPAGLMTITLDAACPTGWAENTALDGKFVVGTLAAHADVGTTGGADNQTPEGTNSDGSVSAHSGTAVDNHASHTHTYTDVPNHVHVQNINSGATGGSNGYGKDTSTNGSEATAVSTANPTGGVATGTTAGPSATLTHAVTQPAAHTFTQPTFAGTAFDNRPAFTKVIVCEKL